VTFSNGRPDSKAKSPRGARRSKSCLPAASGLKSKLRDIEDSVAMDEDRVGIEDVLRNPRDTTLVGKFGDSLRHETPRIHNVDYGDIFSVQPHNAQFRSDTVTAIGNVFMELTGMIEDSRKFDKVVRNRAQRVLRALNTLVVPSAAELLKDGAALVRRSAVRSLGRMGDSAFEHMSRLEVCLTDNDSIVRRCAVSALVQIRCAGMRSYGLVGTWSTDSPNRLGLELSAAVIKCPERQDATDALVRLLDIGILKAIEVAAMLDDHDPHVHCKAAVVLGTMGDRAHPFLDKLAGLLRFSDATARISATVALRKMGGAGAAQVEALLEHGDHVVRRVAIGAVTNICICSLGAQQNNAKLQREIQNATSLSFELIRDADTPAGVTAATSLVLSGQMRPLEIATLLNDPDEAVQVTAAEAMGSIGPEALTYAKKLWPLLSHQNEHIRNFATAALDQMGGSKPSAEQTYRMKTMANAAKNAGVPHHLRRSSHLGISKGGGHTHRPWAAKEEKTRTLSESFARGNVESAPEEEEDDEEIDTPIPWKISESPMAPMFKWGADSPGGGLETSTLGTNVHSCYRSSQFISAYVPSPTATTPSSPGTTFAPSTPLQGSMTPLSPATSEGLSMSRGCSMFAEKRKNARQQLINEDLDSAMPLPAARNTSMLNNIDSERGQPATGQERVSGVSQQAQASFPKKSVRASFSVGGEAFSALEMPVQPMAAVAE